VPAAGETHVPPPSLSSQMVPDVQSLFAVQPVLQAVALAQPRLPGHAVAVCGVQEPMPSQVSAGVSMPFEQDAGAHTSPAEARMHAPFESQSMAPQVPPAEHAVAQQWVPEPVAPHAPLEHWLLPLQVEPAPLWATQEPDTQAFPLVQSELALHALLQIAPPHL